MPWPIVWPLSPLETLWCAVALAGGYAVRGAAGFGSGVVAAPLLTFVLPLSTVAPVITILGLVVSTQQALRDWLLIDWRRLAIFVPGSIVGVALGVLAFKAVDPAALARWLGAYVLLYALYSIMGERIIGRTLTLPRWMAHPVALIGALVATVFGGLAGPIYVTYLDSQKLPKSVFRVTVSTTLLVLGLLRSAAYVASGVFRAQDFVLIGAALLPVAIGTFIGDRFHDRLDPKAFRRGVGILLVMSAIGLMIAH
ncbi:MAG: sulfite exporter TauE/SafE family protein [Burkholderiales bacterium]|nr:sulfite exporter TauE/SafE family protein [Burkholderiales bacterium]